MLYISGQGNIWQSLLPGLERTEVKVTRPDIVGVELCEISQDKEILDLILAQGLGVATLEVGTPTPSDI